MGSFLSIKGVSGLFNFYLYHRNFCTLCVHRVDSDQTPHLAASDPDLHCLPMFLLCPMTVLKCNMLKHNFVYSGRWELVSCTSLVCNICNFRPGMFTFPRSVIRRRSSLITVSPDHLLIY